MNADPQPIHGGTVWKTNQCKTLTMQTFSPGVNFAILPPFPNESPFGKLLTSQEIKQTVVYGLWPDAL